MTSAPQPTKANISTKLAAMSDDDLVLLRARLDVEMKKRKIAFSVGEIGERLAIEHFNATPKLPKLTESAPGTKNVDANSRSGERYSIKTICNAKKTGTIYPDSEDRNKQLFEYLLIVKLAEDWSLESIHQLSWSKFTRVRSWDRRMSAWYVGISNRTLSAATLVFKAAKVEDA